MSIKMRLLRKFVKRSIMTLGNKTSYQNIHNGISQLREAEKLDINSLQEKQKERLLKLLYHAYQHVPYYRNVLGESGVITEEGGAINLGNFQNIPLLNKTIIHQNFEALKSDDLDQRNWYYNASGGSTGELLRVIQDTNYRESVWAAKAIFDEWSGFYAGDRRIRLWGSKRDLKVGEVSLKSRLLQWLNNEIWLNAYHMTEDQMRRYVEKINTFKPKQILAYADSLDDISKFIEHEGLKVHTPKSIMTSAAQLFPEMKERIERVFKTPVFNRYGSREVSDIACECVKHKGLHVSVLTNYVEILRSDGGPTRPEEVGEVVVTSLANYAMPLIRYQIGDLAAWAEGSCDCLCNWPLIKEISGRVSDIFISRDGTRVNGKYFHHMFYFKDWIKRFQIVQEHIDLIRVRIAPTYEFTQQEEYAKEIDDLREKMQSIMGKECCIEI